MVVGRNRVVGLTGFSDKKMSGFLFGFGRINGVGVWRGSTQVGNLRLLATSFGQDLRALVLTCVHFEQDQVCAQVDARLSPSGPPNASQRKFCLFSSSTELQRAQEH